MNNEQIQLTLCREVIKFGVSFIEEFGPENVSIMLLFNLTSTSRKQLRVLYTWTHERENREASRAATTECTREETSRTSLFVRATNSQANEFIWKPFIYFSFVLKCYSHELIANNLIDW